MSLERTTFCNVKIVTPNFGGFDGTIYEFSQGTGLLEGLISVQVSLSLTPPNTFALIFAQEQFETQNWSQKIPQYSLVFIEMGSEGHFDGDDPMVMIGLTGPPVENEKWAENSVQRTVTIAGRGIEAVMFDQQIWHAPYLANNTNLSEIFKRLISGPFKEQLTGRAFWARTVWGKNIDPRSAILQIILYYINNEETAFVNLRLPGEYLIRELLLPGDYTPWAVVDAPVGEDTQPDLPGNWSLFSEREAITPLLLPTASSTVAQGTVAALIARCMDTQLHELYVEYDSSAARIIHRVKPFRCGNLSEYFEHDRLSNGRTAFDLDEDTLKTVTITSLDVGGKNLTYGIDPRHMKNVFFITPGQGSLLNGESIKAYLNPCVSANELDRSFLGRFGVKPLEYISPYFTVTHGALQKDALRTATFAMGRALQFWYDPLPEMWRGGLNLVGRNEFKPGRRLVWEGFGGDGNADGRTRREFYMVGVKHQYGFADGSFTSGVSVERGWDVSPFAPGGG